MVDDDISAYFWTKGETLRHLLTEPDAGSVNKSQKLQLSPYFYFEELKTVVNIGV